MVGGVQLATLSFALSALLRGGAGLSLAHLWGEGARHTVGVAGRARLTYHASVRTFE